MQKLRIGVVSYLNAMPLWFSLQREADIALYPDNPARLAARMAEGALDVAVLPAVEALRQPGLSFFPDLGVGADGPVESVGLFTRAELAEVRAVALTSASRTSQALARVLLHAAGARPAYSEADIAPESLAARGEDAVLMIGDPCLRARKLVHDRVFVDLGAEWKLETGLPFVFALWAGPARNLTPALHGRLTAALQEGRARIYELADAFSLETGLTDNELGHYLEDVIQNRLGPEHARGLAEFARRAAALGLLPPDAPTRAAIAT